MILVLANSIDLVGAPVLLCILERRRSTAIIEPRTAMTEEPASQKSKQRTKVYSRREVIQQTDDLTKAENVLVCGQIGNG